MLMDLFNGVIDWILFGVNVEVNVYLIKTYK